MVDESLYMEVNRWGTNLELWSAVEHLTTDHLYQTNPENNS